MPDTSIVSDGRTTGQVLKELVDRAGLSLRAFARECGYAHASGVQRYVDETFEGKLRPDVAAKMADALAGKGAPPIGTSEVYALIGIPEPNAVVQKFEGASMERMRQDIPIIGTALGAEKIVDGHAIEQTHLYEHEVIGHAKRPVILDGRADAYGIYVQGSSMHPEFRDGSLILVETKRKPAAGDSVVVYLRKRGEDHEADDGETARMVMVKNLVRRSANYVELEQHNPPLAFKIDAKDILKMDRVIPWGELLS
jgi:SOS-response transcriptional repressor LexA